MSEKRISSPKWSTTIKLVVALTFVAAFAGLLIQFRNLLGPLMLALVLAYLVHPLAVWLNRRVRLPWRFSAGMLYLLILFIVLGLLTWGGFALVEQVQSLINFVQKMVNNLPATIQDLTSHPRQIGPFVLDLGTLDLSALTNQVLGAVQPLLTQIGTLVGTFATSAASTLGWFIFTMLVSYFILSEARGTSSQLIYVHLPGYEDDMNRIGTELGRIWNAFLRGQLLITTITVLIYTIMLGILGVRYYFGLALMAGMARFIPYLGPAIAWITYGLVAYFQGTTLFGLSPLAYTAVVVGAAWLTDNIYDNMVTPRLMADALSIHPAAVMVAALVGANLLGVVGVVLASPVLASLKLITNYAVRKMSDRDPWENFVTVSPPQPMAPILRWLRAGRIRLTQWIREKIKQAVDQKKSIPPGEAPDL